MPEGTVNFLTGLMEKTDQKGGWVVNIGPMINSGWQW